MSSALVALSDFQTPVNYTPGHCRGASSSAFLILLIKNEASMWLPTPGMLRIQGDVSASSVYSTMCITGDGYRVDGRDNKWMSQEDESKKNKTNPC